MMTKAHQEYSQCQNWHLKGQYCQCLPSKQTSCWYSNPWPPLNWSTSNHLRRISSSFAHAKLWVCIFLLQWHSFVL